MSDATTQWLLYRPETGELDSLLSGARSAVEPTLKLSLRRGFAALDVTGQHVDTTKLRISEDRTTLLPRLPAPTDLADLPIPCRVSVRCRMTKEDADYTVEDGSFEYDDVPGFYDVEVISHTHLYATIVLEIPE